MRSALKSETTAPAYWNAGGAASATISAHAASAAIHVPTGSSAYWNSGGLASGAISAHIASNSAHHASNIVYTNGASVYTTLSGHINSANIHLTSATISGMIDAKVAGVYKYKGSVDTKADLDNAIKVPNPVAGDVWNVIADNMNYAFVKMDGSTRVWDPLGSTIDLTPYNNHISSAAIHVPAGSAAYWNAGGAASSTISAHAASAAIHVPAGSATYWNAGGAASATISAHAASAAIHVPAGSAAYWNSAYTIASAGSALAVAAGNAVAAVDLRTSALETWKTAVSANVDKIPAISGVVNDATSGNTALYDSAVWTSDRIDNVEGNVGDLMDWQDTVSANVAKIPSISTTASTGSALASSAMTNVVNLSGSVVTLTGYVSFGGSSAHFVDKLPYSGGFVITPDAVLNSAYVSAGGTATVSGGQVGVLSAYPYGGSVTAANIYGGTIDTFYGNGDGYEEDNPSPIDVAGGYVNRMDTDSFRLQVRNSGHVHSATTYGIDITVKSGGEIDNITVNETGRRAALWVSNGGHVGRAALGSGDTFAIVHNGGTVRELVVDGADNDPVEIFSGGFVGATRINGGVVVVSSGAVLSNITLNGGTLSCVRGGTAYGIHVMSGTYISNGVTIF